MEAGLSGSGKCRCKVSKYYTVEKCVKSFEREGLMPGPCIGKNLISVLVADQSSYILRRPQNFAKPPLYICPT